MPRLITALVLSLAAPAAAQEMMLFDSATFGQVALPQKQSALGDFQLESSIGDYNNEFISQYGPGSIFARTGRAVGRLDILTNVGHAPCTAFLVEGNLLITNNHCVPGILNNPKMKEKGANAIVAVQFQAGYIRDGIEEGTQSFFVNPIPLETSEALDYSVLEVNGDANATFGALQLSDRQPGDRDPLWVIGHPLGEAQRISREKCQTDSPAIASGRLRHTCDTLPGNSGSPVIDAGLQQVVALHHAGSRAGSVNFAVPMADILAQSRILKASATDDDARTAAEAERKRLEAELLALRAERDRLRAGEEADKAEAPPAPAPVNPPVKTPAAAPVKTPPAPTRSVAGLPDYLVPEPGQSDPTPLPEGSRGRIGLKIMDLDDTLAKEIGYPQVQGAYVLSVLESSPNTLTFQYNDLITGYHGVDVRDVSHLLALVRATPVGTRVPVQVFRDGALRFTTISIGGRGAAKPEVTGFEWRGLTLEPVDANSRAQIALPDEVSGLIVTAAPQDSAGYASGLRQGDVIAQIDNGAARTQAEFETLIEAVQAGGRKTALVLVYRGANPQFLTIPK